jgi:peptidoglycan/LPS O-acetylase OafA/YrhL
MREVPSLTGLRGAAAIWVMLYHVTTFAPRFGASWITGVPGLAWGWMGVDLFFVLSGFILMRVHAEDFVRPTAEAAARFARARLARVYPLSLAVLGLILLLAWCDPSFVDWARARNPDNFSPMAFVRTALLATRWGAPGGDWNQPVWSLSVEMVGYGVFPLLAWAMSRRSFGIAVLVAAASLLALAAHQAVNGVVGLNLIGQHEAMLRMGFGFTAGVALCRARTLAPPGVAAGAASWAWLACALIVAACVVPTGPILAPAAFALLIFALSFETGAVNGLMASRPMLLLGRLSFPLYLAHITPLMWLAHRFEGAGLGPWAGSLVLVAYLAGALGLAFILHHAVERPSRRWARRPTLTDPTPALEVA